MSVPLPFTPSFFREVIIFQKLKGLQRNTGKKLYPAEEAFLRWAASMNHRYKGHPINEDTLRKVIGNSDENLKILRNSDNEELLSGKKMILLMEELMIDGFVQEYKEGYYITNDGYIAGQILRSINELHGWRSLKYWVIIVVWWMSTLSVLLLLLNEVIILIKGWIDLLI